MFIRHRALGLAFLGAVLLSACPSSPLAQGAQTLAPSQVQHQIGLEWMRMAWRSADPGSPERARSVPFVMPYYGIRLGVSERIDAGIRITSTLLFRFDLKLQPVDGEFVDIAIDPTIQYAWMWGSGEVPLILGLNLSDAAQIIVSGRVAYQLGLTDSSDLSDFDEPLREDQVMLGAGGGLYLRFSTTFGVMPELNVLQGLGRTEPLVFSIGLSFMFQDQPGVRSRRAPPSEQPGYEAPGYRTSPPVYPPPQTPGPMYPYPGQPQPSAPTMQQPQIPPGYAPPSDAADAGPGAPPSDATPPSEYPPSPTP